MSGSFDFPATARSLLRYFTRQEASAGSRWTAGKVAAEEWLRLIERGKPSQEELTRMDEIMLEGAGDETSAWIELKIAYDAWRER